MKLRLSTVTPTSHTGHHQAYNYNTRNCNKIKTECCSFNKTQQSFTFTAVKLYNRLSQSFKSLELNIFIESIRSKVLKNVYILLMIILNIGVRVYGLFTLN